MPHVDEPGLGPEEVARHVAAGETNVQRTRTTRTVGQIIVSNVFTLFNGIILACMVVVLLTGRWKDAVFGFVIIINTLIGVFTELKSKRTLDRLSILVRSKNLVRRGGRNVEVALEDIVLGDTLWIRVGEQVPADARIVESWGLELDESMLTGESRTVAKKPGDMALSGATAVSGLALARVTAVGSNGYAAKLTAEAKVFTKTHSDLQDGINRILKAMTFIVVPLCILLIITQMNHYGGWSAAIASGEWRDAVVSSVAGVVGMIPEGLVLLTSLNFAIAAMRLARKNTLVQELEAVETLARVDCLNLDKTGTITDGGIDFNALRLVDDSRPVADVAQALYDACDEDTPNATGRAILDGLRGAGRGADSGADGHTAADGGVDLLSPDGTRRGLAPTVASRGDVVARLPFSSARKFSAVLERGRDGALTAWFMGAPEVLMARMQEAHSSASPAAPAPALTELSDTVAGLAATGARVLLLLAAPVDDADAAHGMGASTADGPASALAVIPAGACPVALAVCSESVRDDAQETLAWFREQGVRCRVISGDNPLTVAAIARRVRLRGDAEPRAIDARTLPDDVDELADVLEDVDVIGRVLPNQKKAIVQALHRRGHVVAMTGDGVNDALALKEADLGIAMGNAAPATKAVAQVVLVDSKFSHLPDVVARGRQVMANMERVASLFLTKTAYSAIVSLGVVLTGIPFPYLPRHITYIGSLTIGIPAFFLALAPNTRRYIPGFLGRVLRFSIPNGAGIAISLLCCSWILPGVMGWDLSRAVDLSDLRATCVIVLFALSLIVLARVASPLASWRGGLVALCAAAGVAGMVIPQVAAFFEVALPAGALVAPTVAALGIGAAIMAVSVLIGTAIGRRVAPAAKAR
ncbi:HAD-IC family P-type ATPase [Pseudoscardovia radai]|uniref:HAD-IC family P-type ATPase n=1 Tax=Pseudoscardovia radai TaxID=987066 RepID=UPI003993A782